MIPIASTERKIGNGSRTFGNSPNRIVQILCAIVIRQVDRTIRTLQPSRSSNLRAWDIAKQLLLYYILRVQFSFVIIIFMIRGRSVKRCSQAPRTESSVHRSFRAREKISPQQAGGSVPLNSSSYSMVHLFTTPAETKSWFL